jgi:hypothetical protein
VDITRNKEGDTTQNKRLKEIPVVEDNTSKPSKNRRN